MCKMDTSWEAQGEEEPSMPRGAWQGKGRRMKERERMHEKWVKTHD